MQNLHGKKRKNSCTLCSAVAYCCGAVAPRAIAALLGRFLPRLGPLAFASGPFFFGCPGRDAALFALLRWTGTAPNPAQVLRAARPGHERNHSAAAWNGP